MDLSGTWRAAIADDELRRAFPDQDFDDSAWQPVPVPSHWRTTSAFAESDGPLLYRTRFESPADDTDDTDDAGAAGDDGGPGEPGATRQWLVLDGVFYQGDVWLDGTYLGDTEGYFFPHTFEVTDALAARREHALAIEVACSPQRDRSKKRNITGAFQHSDVIDPAWNPGGIWQPVRIERSGPVRIRRLRVVCREATAERAVVQIRATLDTLEGRPICIRTTLAGVEHELEQPIAAGENAVEWDVTYPDPARWWPRALGEQPLHELTVTVSTDNAVSDRRSMRVGVRSIQLRNWICSVNGERLYLKGANVVPVRAALGDATADDIRRDFELAAAAGLDFVRVHAHISRPEFYDIADETGMLVWQDLPLQWRYARGLRKQAVRQAREAVTLLAHHPSIAVWCAHNEPSEGVLQQQLPTWNKTVLDRSLKRALEKSDKSRPVVAHSGVFPHLPQLDGSDSHLYLGWERGDERDLAALCASVPRVARFVGEFGAQAVPASASAFCEPERWPDLDWERLEEHYGLRKESFDRYVPPRDYAGFNAWRQATEEYQAGLVRRYVETLRRLKYRPNGGFALFCLADAMPAVSCSVLDHDRAPKAGYAALQAACRPVIVVADRLPAVVVPGDAHALDVHVVSDRREPLRDLEVRAALRWDGGGHDWHWTGDVDADSCVRVATPQLVVPEAPDGTELVFTLALSGPATATNEYRSKIHR